MASEYTPNYNLDKYVGTDKPNLRDQYNGAMDKIDAQFVVIENDHTETNNQISAINTNMTQLGTRIDEVIDSLSRNDWTDASAGIYASRVGHIVIVTLWMDEDATLTAGKNSLTTLPSGWRPSRPVSSTAISKDSFRPDEDLFMLVVDTDGSAFIWSDYDDTRSVPLKGDLVYFVA